MREGTGAGTFPDFRNESRTERCNLVKSEGARWGVR